MNNKEIISPDYVDIVNDVLDGYPSKTSEVMGISSTRIIQERGRRLLKVAEMNAPGPLASGVKRKYEDAVEELNDPEVLDRMAKEIRDPLSRISDSAKKLQNNVFQICIDYTGGSDFLDAVIKPGVENPEAEKLEKRILALAGENSSKTRLVSRDYVGALTEKDEQGNYVVSNETFMNFMQWYHDALASIEYDVEACATRIEGGYARRVNKAVEDGLLPESFLESASQLDSKSPNYRRPEYCISDYSTPERNTYSGMCSGFSLAKENSTPIWVKITNGEEKSKKLSVNAYVLYHEFSHYISHDDITLGDPEARRIVDEAITETAAYLIATVGESKDYSFGDGCTYSKEREVLKYLQSGGAQEIDPKLFFDAYAQKEGDDFINELAGAEEFAAWLEKQYDYSRSTVYEMDDGLKKELALEYARANRIQKPETKRLFDALYEAFPDCKTPEDIGALVLEKFRSLTNKHE